MAFPNDYTIFSFISTCPGRDLEEELDNHEERIQDLEELVQNPTDVFI